MQECQKLHITKTWVQWWINPILWNFIGQNGTLYGALMDFKLNDVLLIFCRDAQDPKAVPLIIKMCKSWCKYG